MQVQSRSSIVLEKKMLLYKCYYGLHHVCIIQLQKIDKILNLYFFLNFNTTIRYQTDVSIRWPIIQVHTSDALAKTKHVQTQQKLFCPKPAPQKWGKKFPDSLHFIVKKQSLKWIEFGRDSVDYLLHKEG